MEGSAVNGPKSDDVARPDPGSVRTTPSQRLRELLHGEDLLFLMEAHDGVSARIAQRSGFEAIWASGFSISTALGVRDSEEVSWSQFLFVVECMVDCAAIPVVVDGDTGHGDFNTARRFTRKVHRVGAAGLCLEDKIFPKLNSFVGDAHSLASVDEFCGKLEACRAAVHDPAFCLIARTEALIAGMSCDEALERAEAYRQAGADAIFVHSRKSVPDEVIDFARRWDRRLPVVVSPTTYVDAPAELYRANGIAGVVWGNQSMRAAVAAMQRVCRAIRARGSAASPGVEIAPLGEIFDLMDYDELVDAERRYTRSSFAGSR